jgi:hypothetical protein
MRRAGTTYVDLAVLKPIFAWLTKPRRGLNPFPACHYTRNFSNQFQLTSKLLIISISFHELKKETLSYGSMSLLTWFKWMSYIGNPNLSEFRAIAGICKKYSDPLWTRKSDNSQLVKVDFTYNISNIFECLLNIFDLRLSLGGESSLSIDGREFDLNLILDDIVTYGSCSPKSFVKEIRGFLTYVARTAGSLSSETWTYRHECFDPCADRLGVHLSKEQVPGTLSSVFSKCQTYTKVRNNGFSVLASWNQTNLSELC